LGFFDGEKEQDAILYCKNVGKSVLAGAPYFEQIFKHLECTVTWHFKEGSEIEVSKEKGRVQVATVHGKVRKILVGERTALNLLARSSGIATLSRKAKTIANQQPGFKGKVAGTRKTTPGFREFEKYALLVGGADQHRYDLSSMIMLKDNHIWSCGNITNAVKKAKSIGGFTIKVEVECRDQKEAEEAINAGADIIMLDNFEPNLLRQVAKNLKSNFPHIVIESSGGITLENLHSYCSPDVDVISMGCLTQGVPHVDFSLK